DLGPRFTYGLAVCVPSVEQHRAERFHACKRGKQRTLTPASRPSEDAAVELASTRHGIQCVPARDETFLLPIRNERFIVRPVRRRECSRDPIQDLVAQRRNLTRDGRLPRHYTAFSGPRRSRDEPPFGRARFSSASSAAANWIRRRARSSGVAPNFATRSRSSPATFVSPDQNCA